MCMVNRSVLLFCTANSQRPHECCFYDPQGLSTQTTPHAHPDKYLGTTPMKWLPGLPEHLTQEMISELV